MDWNMMGARIESRVSTDYRGENPSPSQFRRALIPNRRCHNEKAPPECPYIMSYTTACNHTGPGGDFYCAKYGIRVEQAANTLIIHNATEFYGTLVHDVNWDPLGKAKDAKENKEPAVKWDTDPHELLEYRGFSLLIPYDLRGMQAQTAASGGGPADSIGGPSAGEGRETEGAADAADATRTEWTWMNKRLDGRRLVCSRNNHPRNATTIRVSSASFKVSS